MAKLTHDEVATDMAKYGYTLLSPFVATREKVKIRCNGKSGTFHTLEMTPACFRKGQRCVYCTGKKITTEQAKAEFAERGYTLLEEYHPGKLKTTCKRGHHWEVSRSFFLRGRNCPLCIEEERKEEGLQRAKQIFAEKGYTLLATEYFDNKTRMDSNCPNGHLFRVNLHDFQKGSKCPCLSKQAYENHLSSVRTKRLDEIKKLIESEADYKLLSTKYTGRTSPLLIQHKDHQFEVTYNNWNRGTRCPCTRPKSIPPKPKHITTTEEVRTFVESQGYQLVGEYVDSKTKIHIICDGRGGEKHDYWVSYYHFKNKNYRCPKCQNISTKRYTQESVKDLFAEKGYVLLSKYKNNHEYLDLICDQGCNCKIPLKRFLLGQRCDHGERPVWNTQTVKEFLNNSPEEERYTLIGEYETAKKPITLKCPDPDHLPYQTLWVQFHSEGKRCQECWYEKQRTNFEAIKEEAKGRGYKVLSDRYVNRNKPLLFECRECNSEFKMSWNKFGKGGKCPHYATNKPHGIEKFVELASERGFDVLSAEYKDKKTHLPVRCKAEGHVTKKNYEQLDNFYGCSECHKGSCSKAEKDIFDFLSPFNPQHQFKFPVPKHLNTELFPEKKIELDIYLEKEKVAIEYCGLYWHSSVKTERDDERRRERLLARHPLRHRFKYDVCKDQGIRLYTIFEDDFHYKGDLILSQIESHILGSKGFSGCDLAESHEVSEFLKRFNLFGPKNFFKFIKLIDDQKVCAILGFNKTKGNFDLTNACFRPGYSVDGIKKWIPKILELLGAESITHCCDLRYDSGGDWENLGFKKTDEKEHNQMVIVRSDDKYCRYKTVRCKTTFGLPTIFDCGIQKLVLEG